MVKLLDVVHLPVVVVSLRDMYRISVRLFSFRG